MAEVAAELPRARMPAPALRLLGDDRLCRIAASGDSRAFAVIYERHHQALYRYCRSIVGNRDDAADALQSTMAAALRGLAGELREISVKPWLFRIAHNECISLLRKRRPHAAIDEALGLEAPEHADAGTRQRLRQLVEDLRELPDAQRGALVMRELNGLRYEEIGAALGGSAATARQAVYEARGALQELVEGRAMECEDAKRALSENDRRRLRGRKLRAHLRACTHCRDFEALTRSRRRDLAAVAPPLPAALAAGLLHQALGGGAGSVSGGGVAGAPSGGIGSLAAGKTALAPALLKGAAVVAATAALGGSAVRVASSVDHGGKTAQGPPLAPTAGGSGGAEPAASGPSVLHAGARGAGPGAQSKRESSSSHRARHRRATSHRRRKPKRLTRHTPAPRSHRQPRSTQPQSAPVPTPASSPAPPPAPGGKGVPKNAPKAKAAPGKSSPAPVGATRGGHGH
jgi:RNA polymerase sigma factor (sigma-70 family)